MTINLDKLSLKELKDLKNKIDITIASYEERKLNEARELVQAQLKELGFKLEDLLEKSPKRKGKGTSVPPKYAHPENPELTWAGRGRKPTWVVDHLERGKSLDDLLIKT